MRRGGFLSRGLRVGQITLCTALLVVAGVFVRTLANLRGQDSGYHEDRLLVADVEFPRGYREDGVISRSRSCAGA